MELSGEVYDGLRSLSNSDRIPDNIFSHYVDRCLKSVLDEAGRDFADGKNKIPLLSSGKKKRGRLAG